jgi:inner membrane protease subunit 1
MVPTISARGNWCYVNHLFRRGRGVKVGDVVVFTHPMVAGAKAAKRVIGLEGDFVCVVTGPSEAEDEDKDLKAQRAQFTTEMVQVPKGHCWVEGDNLEWSRDSRVYGPVPMALIRGKVEMRLWPLSEVGSIRNAVTERVEEEKEVRIVN